jgi:transcription antitermination factor NusG
MTDAGTPASASPLDVPTPEGAAWCVVHARPRSEKQVAAFATRRGLLQYLPLRTKTHVYGGRKRTFQSPLFPGYVFCCAQAADRATLRQNRHVANVLETADQSGLLGQLRQVELALQAGQIVEVLPYLEAGRRVRVTAGPLKGLEGVVLRSKGRTRIVVNVELLQQGVVTEVDGDCLAPG